MLQVYFQANFKINSLAQLVSKVVAYVAIEELFIIDRLLLGVNLFDNFQTKESI